MNRGKNMKCSVCEDDKPSSTERPIALGNPGKTPTVPICDKCYSKLLDETKED